VSTVKVTQVRSTIGQTKAHEGTLRALGLGRIGKSAEHTQGPVLEGQLRHVAHLVTVTPLDGAGKDA
jgi:large subunit ribosomal protein L30